MNEAIKAVILDIKEEESKKRGKIWDPPDDKIIIYALFLYSDFLRGNFRAWRKRGE